MKKVGFIINSRIPVAASLREGMRPHHLITGWDDVGSPMSFMRFRWVAKEVNRCSLLYYELYRPWRTYDAVVFLKSMGPRCQEKLAQLKKIGTRVVFEANVDYYTQAEAINLPGELVPTPQQRESAIAMTGSADTVIASSTELAKICERYAKKTAPIPDNIPPAIVPDSSPPPCVKNGVLHLWWSGMATKLYDFLAVAGALSKFSKNIHLHIVTGETAEAQRKWPPDVAEKMKEFFDRLPHTIHRFRSIPELLRLYSSNGGVIISPRYLDSPYNRSHTEWKLTLGLACGLAGMGSPQPSYLEAAAVAEGALEICSDENQWADVIEKILSQPDDVHARGLAGRDAIMQTYGTPQIAARHAALLESLLS